MGEQLRVGAHMRDREKGDVEQLGDKRRQLGGVRSLSGQDRWVSSERVGIALLRMYVRMYVCVCLHVSTYAPLWLCMCVNMCFP